MGKSSGSIWVSLGLRTANFQKGIKQAKGQLSGFQKFSSGLKGMFNPLTVGIGAVAGLGAALTDAISIVVGFEKANSKLAAVTRASSKDLEAMSNQAKALGSSTAFTASEVTELQTEFAKLGFPTSDILQMTSATLDGAAALGSELGEQAALTGAILKQYGLDAREAARVNDVMAEAAASSALDFEKLSTAMPIVGATAASAGVSLERTTALLGTLSDRGLDASSSGTALRNVFLELSKTGLTYEQAMSKINTATDKNAAALDLFGKRGATAGVILAESGVSLENFENKLNDANGAAKIMAQTMLDNVAGDVTVAKSAWEGFVLSIEDGNGTISELTRSITQLGTTYTSMLTALNNDDMTALGNSWLKHLGVVDDTAKTYETATGKIVLSQAELVKAGQNSQAALDELTKRFNNGSINAAKFQQGVEMLAGGFKRLTAAEKIAKKEAEAQAEENNNLLAETEALLAAEKKAEEQKKWLASAAGKAATASANMRKEQMATAGSFDAVASKALNLSNTIASIEVEPIKLELAAPPAQSWQQMAATINQNLAALQIEEANAKMEKLRNTQAAIASGAQEAFGSMANTIVSSMGEATTAAEAFQQQMVGIVLKLIAQALGAAMANAITGASGAAAVAGPFAPAVLPATIATMTGSVLAAFAAIPAFADGGIVSGPTLGLMGEYGGAKSNPEVIAPLDKLKSLMGNDGSGGGEVKFRIQGNELVGILKRQNKNNNYSN